MARDWESVLATWSRPPSDTEDERCGNAERMVKDAIRQNRDLASRNIRVFTHGSYRNGTNVKRESDVDVGVCLLDIFYDDYTFAAGLSRADTGVVSSSYTPAAFKEALGNALRAQFGSFGVTRGNKVWAIRENTYRVHADVAPTFELRRYLRLSGGGFMYESGTRLTTDTGLAIDNWPEQHANNAIAKNERTGTRFKKIVRIVKRLRDEMVEQSQLLPAAIPSCLIESLLWNAPDNKFMGPALLASTQEVVGHLASVTSTAECATWVEINERKYLFHAQQAWNQAQAASFLLRAYALLRE